ncbi:glycosyl hydrolase [Bacteroidota bacterium]
MLKINHDLNPEGLKEKLERFWQLSGEKIRLIQIEYDPSRGSPVFTAKGKYTTRGWTEWTQGFQFGSAILQFDATGDHFFLDYGKENTLNLMAPHISHMGVHDHGFNNISTYGNLFRVMKEGKIPHNQWEQNYYEMALKVSGAVQASRWTEIINGGFIHSFNGPHSLFVDTLRSCRILMLSHGLGHVLQVENDVKINLLKRALHHIRSTAHFSVYYGEGRDNFDVWGRTAHESVFNTVDGNYRCPNSQQGFSGFSTWTRGLAWGMCGFAEELEFLQTISDEELRELGGREYWESLMLKAAKATCDYYIDNTPQDGIPYWDTGAPNLHRLGLGDYLYRNADPFNHYEPVDSSAAAIASQGLMRLGNYLQNQNDKDGDRYWQAGLTVIDRLLEAPYLSEDPDHQGLILHSVYHQPNRWDHLPEGSNIPYGESGMWGDYHAREAALYVWRLITKEPYYTFFNILK